MNPFVKTLLDKHNTLDLQQRDKLGSYHRIITYSDAEKAIEEIRDEKKLLEGLVLHFRQKLAGDDNLSALLLKEYDTHFNITVQTQGRIGP